MKAGEKLAVAVSGGKDSIVMLRRLRKMFDPRGGVELIAIIADEGISGYREKGIEVSKRECSEMGIPLHIVSYKELFGMTLDEMVERDPDTVPCTYCGVFRRNALNRTAKKVGASRFAFGHNLNDTAGSVLMNVCRGDVERLARLGPHEKARPGLVPRIIPLRMIPEEECALYAIIEKMDILADECPYAYRAHRGEFVELMARLEDVTPGTRHAIMSSYQSLKPGLASTYKPAGLKSCSKCGEPAIADTCKACQLIWRLEGLK